MKRSDLTAVTAITVGTLGSLGLAALLTLGSPTAITVRATDGSSEVTFGMATDHPGIARQSDDFTTPQRFRLSAGAFEGIFLASRPGEELEVTVESRMGPLRMARSTAQGSRLRAEVSDGSISLVELGTDDGYDRDRLIFVGSTSCEAQGSPSALPGLCSREIRATVRVRIGER